MLQSEAMDQDIIVLTSRARNNGAGLKGAPAIALLFRL